MNIRFFNIVLLLSCMSMLSCSDRGKSGIDGYFSLSDFREEIVELADVEFSPAVLDGLSASVQLLGNSVVLLSPRSGENLLTRFEFETGDKELFLSRGRGPQELLGVGDMYVTKDTLFVYDTNERKILNYLRTPADTLAYGFSIIVDDYYHRIIPTPKGDYLGSPMKDARFKIISRNGDSGEAVGSFLPVKGPREAVNSQALQTLIAFSPDGSHVCSAYQNADCIEFYDSDLNLKSRLIGPERHVPEVTVWRRGDWYGYSPKPYFKAFMGLCATEKVVFIGYVGYERKSGDPEKGLNSILTFDWDGNCKERYILPFELVGFDIDADNRLVGVTFDHEHPQLVRFPLPDE